MEHRWSQGVLPASDRRRKGRSINVTRRISVVVCMAFALSLLSGLPADAASSRVEYKRAKVIRWIDGDTVVTSRGTVRLIGVDTPERDHCGYSDAKRHAKSWAPRGSRITLGNPRSVRNEDKYGRSLRYVLRGKRDISRSQIRKGARARYDSLDGYQWHRRQAGYRKADAARADYACSAPSPAPDPVPVAPPSDDMTSYPPTGTSSCPSGAPIKGNRGSRDWIYHLPGQQYYGITNPEECFASERAAVAAGYRAAKV